MKRDTKQRFDRLLQMMATQPEPSETPEQKLEHQSGLLPQVMAILELAQVKSASASSKPKRKSR